MSKASIQYLVNCGSTEDYVDSQSRRWLADREYSAGSWGWFNPSQPYLSSRSIDGTLDDLLYQTQRYGDQSSFVYRFDLPTATYEVELGFAELYSKIQNPGQRIFDVRIEGLVVLDNFDVVAQAPGAFRAVTRTFITRVADGQLNVAFDRDWRPGNENPIINTIRVTELFR